MKHPRLSHKNRRRKLLYREDDRQGMATREDDRQGVESSPPPSQPQALSLQNEIKTNNNSKKEKKTYMNWSTGKDCSFALYKLLQNRPRSSGCQHQPQRQQADNNGGAQQELKGGDNGDGPSCGAACATTPAPPLPPPTSAKTLGDDFEYYDVDLLVTTVNTAYDRVSMHGIRRELLQKQAEAIGIPLRVIDLPEKPSLEEYYNIMARETDVLKNELGYDVAAFGDIFLEDLKKSREEKLATVGIRCVFPLWKIDTRELIREFWGLGFKAVVVCVTAKHPSQDVLDESFVGRDIDESFVNDLPADSIDACGENGEFHTFCYDGPIFTNGPVRFEIGDKTYRENEYEGDTYGSWFVDLVPVP